MKHVKINGHTTKWVEAIRARFDGEGEKYGREEFDDFLSNYGGISDLPAVLLAADFITAYPKAKIILSTRDEDGWMSSMRDTIVHHWTSHPPANGGDGLSALLSKHLWADDFEANGLECFRRHNAMVRELAPEGRLLEFNVKEGWGPLCGFLERDVPQQVFPRCDDWKKYKDAYRECRSGHGGGLE